MMADETAPAFVAEPAAPAQPTRPGGGREVIYRHGVIVRITHWINVLAISLLLMSGLQIFNAHPRLYWGMYGADADKPWLELVAKDPGADKLAGVARVAGREFTTTGVLGVSADQDGAPAARGFPKWATLPSDQDLATGRRWHFFLAWLFAINGLVYLLVGAANGHFRRDLAPTAREIGPRNVLASIVDHIRLKHPAGEEARRYNILQKLTYLAVVFVLLPAMVASGLVMSPGIDAAAPWLVSVLGGRASARSIHFICADLIVLFVIVHVVEVFLAGVWNEMVSMITGRYSIRTEPHS
jgi:thiosulfate reductase cytochrome b subunit